MSGVALAMRSAPARKVIAVASRIDAFLRSDRSIDDASPPAPRSRKGVMGLGPWA